MRLISTGLLVSFQVSLCSSLWGRGQHTHARHTNRSSGQFPAFPLLKPFEEGRNTPMRVASASLPVNLLLSPCSFHPAKNLWMRRSRVASPTIR